MTEYNKIKLFLLSDMIDDILMNEPLQFNDKRLYRQIAVNVKKLTTKYSDNNKTDFSLEFDLYKNRVNDMIDEIMK